MLDELTEWLEYLESWLLRPDLTEEERQKLIAEIERIKQALKEF